VGRGRTAGRVAAVTVWIEIGGKRRRVELPVGAGDGGALDCVVDGRGVSVDAQALQDGVMSLVVEGRQYRCVLDGDGVVIGGMRFGFAIEDPRSLQGRRGVGGGAEGPRPVKAPMPGRVVRLLVEAGDEVVEGQGIVVIEAMKMQNELKAPKAGRVARVAAVVGETVGSGDVLAIVE
jgi:acetyl/propionyl-CoA carboxylase alpha subunit